ncbi:MAG: hypothetical protein NTY01_17340 [Verrucomicrobia bacterium]|nr:hypothetical protein [Verrucomicrobiota bacterium]
MNRISRPVVVLVVVGVVLGLFALGGRKGGERAEAKAKVPPPPAGAAVKGDAKAALENLITLLNKDDAAKLRELFTVPCYIDGRKIEDEQSLADFIQKAVEKPHAFALEAAVQTTAREAGLPPEADDVLTSNDSILVADLRDNGEPVRRIFIFRKTGDSFKVLAIGKPPAQ